MSYATRCTACGTIFRVVQDQLRVSEGWVRCGRCAEVFDAREQLFDIDLDSPPTWGGDAPMPTPMAAEEVASPAAVMDDAPPSITESQTKAAAIAESGTSRARYEPQWVDEAGDGENDRGMRPASASKLETTDESTADITPPESGALPERLNASIAESRATSAEIPSFMRAAPSASRWKSSGIRLMMAGSALLLLLGLALQTLFHFRDAIAALYPQSLPSLHALCQTSGCAVQAWRRIEAVSIENSALAQAADSGSSDGSAANNRYRLILSLRNKSSTPVATPSIELSLLNPSGMVVLRRVISPTALYQERTDAISPIAIPPGGDVALHTQLTTGTQRISGYSVEIFHP